MALCCPTVPTIQTVKTHSWLSANSIILNARRTTSIFGSCVNLPANGALLSAAAFLFLETEALLEALIASLITERCLLYLDLAAVTALSLSAYLNSEHGFRTRLHSATRRPLHHLPNIQIIVALKMDADKCSITPFVSYLSPIKN